MQTPATIPRPPSSSAPSPPPAPAPFRVPAADSRLGKLLDADYRVVEAADEGAALNTAAP